MTNSKNLNFYYNKKIINMLIKVIYGNSGTDKNFWNQIKDVCPEINLSEEIENEDSADTYSKLAERTFLNKQERPYVDMLPRIIKWNGEKEDADYMLTLGNILFLNNPYYESIVIDEYADFVYGGEIENESRPAFFYDMTFGRTLDPNSDMFLNAKFRKTLVDGEYKWHVKIYNARVFAPGLKDEVIAKDGYELEEGDYVIVLKGDSNVYIVHSEDDLNKLNFGID